ncbi:GAF domain-containing protein [Chamaesiphon sp.]|uniref:GAF domain-containing sensor histidine kinase n=1 Tax=Chamaesiphon sp. TaxID=2814140 RepID=UPI003593749F
MEYFTNFWKSDLFIPHGHCYLWKTELVGLHLISDLTIAIAYFSIPLTLFYFVEKREDLPFNWIFNLFGAFIILCGTTHLLEVWTLWHPVYWLSGTVKAATGIVSVYTAIVLVKLMPQALLIPSPSQLAATNQALEQQIRDRELVEAQLQQVNNELQAQLAAEYRNLFESIDQGFCIVEAIFDTEEKPVDYRFLQVNPAFVRLTGLPASAIGKTVRELVPDLERFWIETYGNVALTGEPVRFENKSDALNRWFDVYASKLGDATSRRVAILFTNITERKQAEQISQLVAKLDAFRITLADALRPLADPIEIQATASRVLGEHLDANRVAYFEVRGSNYVVERDYTNGATAISGSYSVDSFGEELLAAYRSGRAVFKCNIAADPDLSPAEKSGYAAIEIGAYIGVPLVKGGEFIAGLAVHSIVPRVWTPDEMTLVKEVAEKTWGVLERARAQAALRESEAKYRTLFESMDEGYVLMDLIFDANDRLVDLYYLEANPAAVRMMGTDPVGIRASEIFTLESPWLETLGHVAQIGIGERQELYTAQLDTWYSFYIFKIADAQSRRVAIIYDDVTERKRREANLAFLTEIQDEFTHLVSPDEIMQAVGEKIGAYLNISQCVFGEIDRSQDRCTIEYDWHNLELPDLIGVYQVSDFVSEGFVQAAQAREAIFINNAQTDARTDADRYAAFNIYATALVPFHRGNEWKYLLGINDSRARQWREDEIELISELANRIFPRLERARAEAIVAANLRDTRLLRDLSARLVTEDDTQTLYREILATAIALTGADAGTVQILDDRSQDLLLLATQGFDRPIIEHFYRVNISSHTSCGIALRNGERAVVDFDVPEAEDPDGSMRLHFEAGYRSAQSTPLISRTGKPLGMVSTHWRSRHRPNEREMRSLDLLARQAADLIEQQQTTAALRESEAKLRFILDSSQIGEWDLNLTTQPHTADRSLIHDRIFGYESLLPEWNYEIFLTHVHPKDRATVDEKFQQTLTEGTDWNFECRIIHADSSIHWIWARSSIYHDSSGTPTRLLGMVVDFTDRKQMETALAERNQELDSFVYIVSHDLKAPLRAISNLSVWIEEDLGPELPAEIQQQMSQLRGRAQRMEAMINGLLEYARVGRTDTQIQLVSVAELLAEILDSLAPPSTFKIVIAPDLPTFHTKRLLLSQVFANLIGNAFKHHDKSNGFMRISSQEQGDFYEFTIVDDGPGIPQEQHDRVFIIFQSINPQKNSDSTGIGLSIVKKIVETVGGQIWLQSELGKGTTFYFTWPK